MFAVVDVGAQTGKCTFLILRLVTRFRTLHQDFLLLARVRVCPHIAGTHTRLHLVHVLTTSTRRTEGVPLDFTLVNLHVESLRFGQYSHRSSRCVYTSLRLGHRHTLHAMHPRFILHRAIHILARHVADDFLVATHSALRERRHREVPALHLAVFRVHAEEVARKQSSLVATRTATDFQRHVLAVLRVGRDEQELDFLLQLRDALLVHGDFLTRHLLHFGVILHREHLLRLLQTLHRVDVLLSGLHDVLQILVFLCQLHIPLLVGNDIRVGNEG